MSSLSSFVYVLKNHLMTAILVRNMFRIDKQKKHFVYTMANPPLLFVSMTNTTQFRNFF
jgi:hypothetical protein